MENSAGKSDFFSITCPLCQRFAQTEQNTQKNKIITKPSKITKQDEDKRHDNKNNLSENKLTSEKCQIIFRRQSRKETTEKGRDLIPSCDKSPYTHRKTKKETWQHTNATKNFDYTTIADRLRTVNWGNDSHPTGVVKPVNGIPTFPLIAKAV